LTLTHLTSTLTEIVDLDGDVDSTVDVDGLTLDVARSAERTSEGRDLWHRSDANLDGSRASTVGSPSPSPSNASTVWVNVKRVYVNGLRSAGSSCDES